MKYNPHDYQSYATQFIIEHPICYLMLDLGLGKTVITLSALWELLLDYFTSARVLVIAPKRVAENTWTAELAKWSHLKGLTISKIMGSAKQREAALKKIADIYIISRDNLAWLVKNHKWDFDTVIIDEMSSFKSNTSLRFKSLKHVRPKVRRVVALSGSPAPNSIEELWPQMYILDMGERLGRYIGSFRNEYLLPDKRNGQIIYSYKPRKGAEQKIYDKISDICISMKAGDYLKMPPLVSTRYEVEMDKKEARAYEQMESDMFVKVGEEDLDAVNAAALSNKLIQMANGAVYGEDKKVIHIHDKKLDALEDIIEAANGKPLLVAYWYKHDKERIKSRFDVREIDTPKDIEDWNIGNIPVAIIHPASAGHGLNLQSGGSTIIWFGLTWSLELYQQLNGRLFRQGQEHTVVIQHIVCKGTIDEDVMDALDRKDAGQTALIAAVKARIGGRA